MAKDAHYYEEKAESFSLAGDAEGVAAALYQAAVHDVYLRSQRQHYSGYLFALHYLEGLTPEDFAKAHLAYKELYREEETLPPPEAYDHEKIRLGFLVPRLVEGSVMRFAEPLLLGLDRERFEVFAFSLGDEQDSFTAYLKKKLNEQGQAEYYFCLYGLSLEDCAMAIRQQEIDILFDLGGHSEGGQTLMIMARKPAPVQLSGLGYFDILGLPEGVVNGFLADEMLLPLGEEEKFFEPVFRLPQALVFKPTGEMKAYREKLSWRKSTGAVTFGVLQNALKVTDTALMAWGRILQEVPGSRLLIKDVLPEAERMQSLRQRAASLGLPLERIEFMVGSLSFWHIYREVDLVLDTFPYPGGFMTALALYFGVPVVTLKGDSYNSRFGASLLKAAGREEWIAGSVEEYVARAATMGRDRERLREEQAKLFEEITASPLLAVQRYVEMVQSALLERLF